MLQFIKPLDQFYQLRCSDVCDNTNCFCTSFTGRIHAKEAMEKREPIMPSNHFIKTFFESFAEDPIFNSVDKEKEGDVDETENQPGKNATNKYVL